MMSLDRRGEPLEPDDPSAPWHDPRCRSGWLGHDDELRPIPCPVCRPHTIRRSEIHTTTPSLRAQQAYRDADRKERDR